MIAPAAAKGHLRRRRPLDAEARANYADLGRYEACVVLACTGTPGSDGSAETVSCWMRFPP